MVALTQDIEVYIMWHMSHRNIILSGRKEIQKFTGRPWKTIKKWINERHFPAAKIDGRWMSTTDEICSWFRQQIKNTGHE